DMITQESEIVGRLKFQFTVPTPLAFAERFLKMGTHEGLALKYKRVVYCMVYYLLEHCLMSYQLCRNLPSKVAAACLAYALLCTNSYSTWVTFFCFIFPKFLETETQYTIDDLFPLIQSIDEIVKRDGQQCKHKAIRKNTQANIIAKFVVLPFLCEGKTTTATTWQKQRSGCCILSKKKSAHSRGFFV
ncbi:hypothetical protein RFI_07213, partial [Reticulomyxa filosa]